MRYLLTSMLLLVAACGTEAEDQAEDPPEDATESTTIVEEPEPEPQDDGESTPASPDCTPGEFAILLDNQLGEYSYNVSLPCPDDSEALLPTLIVFHGMPGSGIAVQGDSNLDDVAAEAGFMAVYPTNPSGRWQAAATGSDIEFVSDLLDELVDQWQADPERLYVAGWSNGGDMALAAGANLTDRIAGVAPVTPSGTGDVYTAVEELRSPLPLVAFIGNNDSRYGESGYQGVEIWLEQGGCTNTGTEPGDDFELETWDCADGTPAEVYRVDGGHEWFGSPNQSNRLWASQALWDFFTGTT